MDRRPPRRKLALLVGALVLAVPGLGACGFNYATDREYTPTAGVNDKSGAVDVLNALIVSSTEGSGTFSATLSNNSSTDTISLDALSFGSNSTVQVASFAPIQVKPNTVVNLSDGQGVKVSGSFKTGDFLSLSLEFDNGETADMDVPVLADTYEYKDLDNGTGSPSPAATTSESPS